jgi:hypothetical protein
MVVYGWSTTRTTWKTTPRPGVVQIVNPESREEIETLVDELGRDRVLELAVLNEELGRRDCWRF